MPNAIFPSFPGQTITVHKKPTFSTRVAQHVSGRVVRAPLYPVPLWQFELQFEVLSASAAQSGVGASTYQSLLGFYCNIQESADTFLFSDPTDNQATNQPLGTGNGAQTVFILTHTFAYYVEAVGQVPSTGLEIYVNGTLADTSTYSVTLPNAITFHTAPAAGAVITGTYPFYFICRFLDDEIDMERIFADLWQLGSLKFISMKP
jgi:uncharacterized protein (TIGR02217 family)